MQDNENALVFCKIKYVKYNYLTNWILVLATLDNMKSIAEGMRQIGWACLICFFFFTNFSYCKIIEIFQIISNKTQLMVFCTKAGHKLRKF